MGSPRSATVSTPRAGIPGGSAARVLGPILAWLHALPLLVALLVPLAAVYHAAAALLAPGDGELLHEILKPGRWAMLLGNTAIVCAAAVGTALPLGGTLALLVTRTNLPGRRLLTGAALFGACIPIYVSTVVFFALVPAYQLAGSALAAGVLYGLVYTPVSGLILGATFRAADPELEDLALLDAPPRTVLLRVAVPAARGGIGVAALVTALLVTTDFTIADVLAVPTFAREAYSQYALDRRHAGPLLTALPVLLLLGLALVLAQRRYARTGRVSPETPATLSRTYALGRWRPWTIPGVIVVLAAGLAAPLVALVLHIDPLDGAVWRIVRDLLPEVGHAALVATSCATIAVLAAAGLAWSLIRGRRTRWLTGGAVIVLLALPAPVVGITLILLTNTAWLGDFYDHPAKIVLGHLVRFLPFAVLLLVPGVQRISPELEDAAALDGCGWLRTHVALRWPNLWRDAAVAWLIIVVFSFGEVGTTVLLQLPGWSLASVRAFTLIHFGVYRDLALLAILAALFILLPWALLYWSLRRAAVARARRA